MSKASHALTNDQRGEELPEGAPTGQVNDPSYKIFKSEMMPVIDDDTAVEETIPMGAADSDKQLDMVLIDSIVVR